MKSGMRQFHLLIYLLFLGGVSACEQTVEADGDLLGFNYFPLEIGQFVSYQVEVERYNVDGEVAVESYQLQERITDTFTDISGRTTYVVERYRRPNETATWQIDSVWSAVQNGRQAIRTENNLDFVKLVFPLEAGLSWDGNVFNALGEQIYRLQNYRDPLTLNDLNFMRTLQVVQVDDSSLVTRLKRVETYAEDVGLIDLDFTNVRYRSEGEFLGQGIIEFGTIYRQKVIDYGKNEPQE